MFVNDDTLLGRARRSAVWGLPVVLALGLIGVGGWLAWHALRPAPAIAARPVPLSNALDPPATAEALIFVSGAVASPGMYRLPAGARIADAIAAAGGVTADADPGHLPNLAARVHDGRQVNVPFRRSRTGATSGRLDINTATPEELSAVPGMPAGLPEAIVEYRDRWGGFVSLTDLRTALGVDSATVQGLRQYLRVAPPP
jgi:competence protein ComEA